MTPEEIRTLFAQRAEAFKRHDVGSLMTAYADDCVLESPIGGTLIGRDAIEKAIEGYFVSSPDMAYEFENPLIIGDHVVQTAVIHGTDTGGFLGQLPTRKPFRFLIVFLCTLKGRQIVHDRRVYDFSGLLLQLAGETGGTGDSARLYRATLDRVLSEQELSIAAEIQQALLPPSRYIGTGYEVAAASTPCRAIGGDFFDYFDLPNGGFGFALGDVAGKGPPAALLAATIQGIFASHAQLGGTPAETLNHVNQVLVRRTIESRFATVIYGVLLRDGHFTYCNAGHNPPFLIGRGGQRRFQKGGLILGVFKEATFEEETVQLHAGDTLVVFSDGITEAVDSHGEEFGEERLLACLQSHQEPSPDDLLKRLFDAVRQFSAGAAQSDDLTALVLRYSGV